jgi:hypothetical protein
MLGSLSSDFIAREVEFRDCLYEMRKSWMMDEEGICLTVLFRKASLKRFPSIYQAVDHFKVIFPTANIKDVLWL